MLWVDKYSNIPFKMYGNDFSGCDCWGLVKLIYNNELKIQLPDFQQVSRETLREVFRTMNAESIGGPWKQVERGGERPYDVVLMRGQFSHGTRLHSAPIHVGCVVEPGFLVHIEANSAVVMGNYAQHPRIKDRVHGFFTYCQ